VINDTKRTADERMKKSILAFKDILSKMRTGRASTGLLEHIMVDYYGNPTPLNQVANITVFDARTLMVAPWEKTMVPAIEKAIMTADLGLNPATSGTSIRVPLPALSEERRKEFVKLVGQEAENARISIRNIRRDANGELKELLKKKEISEDDDRRGQEVIQKLTDQFMKEIDEIFKAKEAELMQV
jgi:ribosome recycling factor